MFCAKCLSYNDVCRNGLTHCCFDEEMFCWPESLFVLFRSLMMMLKSELIHEDKKLTTHIHKQHRGRGDDGRLGHGDNGWKYVPRLTHSLTGQIITRVTCGSYHTAAVSSNGDLYVRFLAAFS